MKVLTTILTLPLLAVATYLSSTKQTITATVVNASSDDGKISFALYNKETFMKTPIQSKNAKIVNGKSTVTFEEVESGEYAVVCFHDKNNNDKMDFQESGMPMEDYGSSNNVMQFGPPNYRDSKFILGEKDITVEIKF